MVHNFPSTRYWWPLEVRKENNRRNAMGLEKELKKWPFGVHKDKDIEDIPNSYLEWIVCEKWFEKKYPDLVKEIDKELKFRERFNIHI